MTYLQEPAWLLMPLALLGLLIAWLAYSGQRSMINAWGSPDNATAYGAPLSRRRFVAKGIIASLALAAGLSALTRPAIQSKHVEFQAGTVDVVVLLDVSRSMAARDCQGVSRMKTARTIIKEEIAPSMQHNQIGIIAYAGRATPVVFLTEQLETVYWLTDNELKISSAPGQGSAMGQAFELAFKFFDHDSGKGRRKMIIMLSDGGTDDDTNLAKIAEGCQKRDVSLIIAGLGTPAPAMIPVAELSPEERRLYQEEFLKIENKTAWTSLEEGTLNQLARSIDKATYVPVTAPSEFKFKPLASELNPTERAGQKEVYFYPCLVFFLLICLTPLATRRGRPSASAGSGSAGSVTQHEGTQS